MIRAYRKMLLTVRHLRLMSACPEQVDIFAAEWPDGVKLTRKALLRAVELRLDLQWFAIEMLDAPALAVYYKACDEARAVYDKACAEALWLALPAPRAGSKEEK